MQASARSSTYINSLLALPVPHTSTDPRSFYSHDEIFLKAQELHDAFGIEIIIQKNQISYMALY